MKLFHKFFIALLLVSLVPMIIYSVILVVNTGTTLTNVIDRNNINTLGNIVRDINKYLAEVEDELDTARYIERTAGIADAEKNRLIVNKLSNSKLLYGLYLIDKAHKVKTGMLKDNDKMPELDDELLSKMSKSGEVELGGLRQTGDSKPFFDIVYPLGKNIAETVYFRVRIDGILSRINTYLQQEEKNSEKDILLIDENGNTVSSKNGLQKSTPELYSKYSKLEKEAVFKENGVVKIPARTGGPRWIIVFTEPQNTAYAPVRTLWFGSIALILVSAGLALAGAFTLAGNLTRPVKNLISGIEIVASGNLDYRVPEVSKDELSKLVSIFNSMTIKLKGLQEDVKRTERLSTIGQMANILGHEIRNPLSAIHNASYLMKMEDVEKKFAKRIEVVDAEIKSMEKIINDMLDFSRTRKPVLAKQDINEVLKTQTEQDARPDGIKVIYEFGDVVPVPVDIEEIKQVIRNLINNAVHSMKDSKEKILTIITGKTTVQTSGKTHNAVFFEIKDTGCGIKRDDLHKIFEPFYSNKSHGTGLGLAVVKRVVEERHSGTVSVRSEEGKGTSFFVKLPTE